MTRQEKMARFIDLIRQINDLDVNDFANVRVKSNAIYEVFFVGGAESLPEGDVKYESYDDKKLDKPYFYPWKAVVEKEGIRYTALVTEDEAWSLYV